MTDKVILRARAISIIHDIRTPALLADKIVDMVVEDRKER